MGRRRSSLPLRGETWPFGEDDNDQSRFGGRVEKDIEQRLEAIIERRRAELSAEATGRDDASHARRLAHNRLLVELPRTSARIASAVGLLNDRLYDTELSLKVDLADHTPIAEAIYTVSIVGVGEAEPTLVMTVDYTGSVRCMLKRDDHRTLVGSYTVHTLDTVHLMEMLVSLLEAHYH
jgi:hypothetical protein